MDRRLLAVLGMSVVLALVVAAIFYQVSSRASAKAPSAVYRNVVVAVEPLPLGLTIKPNHVKIAKMPVEMFPKTAFSKVDDVLDRSVISNIMSDEPLLEGRLAPRGSGMGLAPIIPTGMRGQPCSPRTHTRLCGNPATRKLIRGNGMLNCWTGRIVGL